MIFLNTLIQSHFISYKVLKLRQILPIYKLNYIFKVFLQIRIQI